MSLNNIFTERLVLIPFTLSVSRSLLAQQVEVLRELNLQPTRYWPDQESMDTLPRIIKHLEKIDSPTGFESWMIVLKNNSTVIGDAGFKGVPDKKGAVDIGYSIIEQEQHRGYGLETAQALVNWAFCQQQVQTVTAKCLLENVASVRILEKLGMEEIVRDDEVIYWKLERTETTTRSPT